VASPEHLTETRCTKRRCRYRGIWNTERLAYLLAGEALAGHAEYRLIN
jgi:hypothetical protein